MERASVCVRERACVCVCVCERERERERKRVRVRERERPHCGVLEQASTPHRPAAARGVPGGREGERESEKFRERGR